MLMRIGDDRMRIQRRTWMKAAAAAIASAALPGCKPEVHKLVPYLIPDDEIVPGVADWYASTCGECSAGCGVLVRTMEGRAKKLEGNPDHPVNEGKLCARGQAGVQALYHPDRLRRPMSRDRRAAGGFTPVTWDEAVRAIAEALRDADGRIVAITKPLSGSSAAALKEFVEMVGGRVYWYDPAADLPHRTAVERAFGVPGLPYYDLAETDYLLSLGAPFLEHWISPVSYGVAFGRLRRARPTVRGRFIHVEPRLSLTAASADEWIPIRPGTQGFLALGLGRVLLAESPYRLPANMRTPCQRVFGHVSLDDIAQVTDVPKGGIVRLGKELAAAQRPLVLGGGAGYCQTNGTESLMTIACLNAALNNIGRSGGVRYFEPAAFPTGRAPTSVPWLTEQTVEELAEEFGGTSRPVLLFNGCNPLFSMPPTVPIERLVSQAAFVASFCSFLDETAAAADVVCPSHHWLESWGDSIPDVGIPKHTVSLRQPAVNPLYDTRQMEDMLLEITGVLERKGVPGSHVAGLLKQQWTRARRGVAADLEKQWIAALQRGGSWEQEARSVPIRAVEPPPSLPPTVFMGSADDFPLVLYPYPSTTLGYDGAHLPWLQELPDTMTTVMWGSWIEINPATAAKFGVAHGEIVLLESEAGSLEAPALLYPGIHPDVIGMPIGQGRRAGGRYATGRGVNPLQLVVPAFDRMSGAFATGATRVRVTSTGRKGSVILSEQPAIEHAKIIRIEHPKPL